MRITLYAVPETLASAKSDTPYLLRALEERYEVTVSEVPDVERAQGADIVFCRFKLPIRSEFLREMAPLSRDRLVINDPEGQLRLHTKRQVFHFPQIIPPTEICESADELEVFLDRHRTVVVKPLDRHMGVGVTRLRADRFTGAEIETWLREWKSEFGTPLVQKYVEEVESTGCRRINVFGYEPISVEAGRPAAGEFICLESLGAKWTPASLSSDDEAILDQVIPVLKENRIWWAGIDVMGPYLGELNVVQPNTVLETDLQHGDTRGRDAMLDLLEGYRISRGIPL